MSKSTDIRLSRLEAVINSIKTPNLLPAKTSIVGNEIILIWDVNTQKFNRYQYSDVISSGSIDPTNDIKQVFINVPNIDFNLDVATQIESFINSQTTPYEKTGSEEYYFVVTRIVLNNSFDSGFQTIRDFYRLSYPKGTYGYNETQVDKRRLLKEFRIVDELSNIQEVNYSATSGYSIDNIVNNGTAFTPIPSATILFIVDVDSGTSTDYYLYQGKTDKVIGLNEYQISIGDTRYLNTASPDNYNPIQLQTGWEQRFQADTQALSAGDNVVFNRGTSESNGGLTLLNADGAVVPIQINDSISVDFGCTVVTPSTNNEWVKVSFQVGATIYRALTQILIKGSGQDHEISLSANLPVGSDFASNILETHIECSTAVDVKNKYIKAERNHIAKV